MEKRAIVESIMAMNERKKIDWEKWPEKLLSVVSVRHFTKPKPVPISPQGYKYATLNQRMLAATLDAALIVLLLMPFNELAMQYISQQAMVDTYTLTQALMNAHTSPEAAELATRLYIEMIIKMTPFLLQFQYTVLAIYSFIFWHFYSSTPGKMLLRMRIVDAKSGERISDWQSFMRLVGYLIAGIPLCIGMLAVGWSKTKQGWHDHMARTAVIVLPRRKGAIISAPAAVDPSDSQAPASKE